MTEVIYAHDKDFDDVVINSTTPVFVDFYAEWCGPCKMIAPILEGIAREDTGVKIVKVDVDQNPEISQKYGIRSIPTMHLFKNGEITDSVTGADINKIKQMTASTEEPYVQQSYSR